MAVRLQFQVTPATQDQFEQLDSKVGQSMMEAGGPPDGLMAHVVYPEADGCIVAEVWRSEEAGVAYVDDVLRPLLNDLGLAAGQTDVQPVWSFARP